MERYVDGVGVGVEWDFQNRGGFGAELEWYIAGVAHLWYARRDMLW